MIVAITALLACQLAGELIVRSAGLPFPGPVLGMLLLLILLLIKTPLASSSALEQLTQGMLKHLSLLFIPASVGVMVHFELLSTQWLPILLTMICSTAVTMAVTGWVMQKLLERKS